MVGGAGVGKNENKDLKSSRTSLDKSTKDEQNSQKESCVNYFASVLLGLVSEAASDFLKQIFSMTLIVTPQQRLHECSWNKINKATVVQSLYFKAVSLVFQNLTIN